MKLALVTLFAVTTAAAPSFVVQGDARIGTFAVKADGSLASAVRAFGTPRLKRTGEACRAVWPAYGLTVSFYNLGGANPCAPRFGRFSRAIMYGTRWRSEKGLRIGMASSEIKRYYPQATFRRGQRYFWPSGWWVVTRRERFGGGGFYPGLLAVTANGKVISFHVRYPAGGD
jgi:hypothetical protein